MTKFKKLWVEDNYGFCGSPVLNRRRIQDVLAGDISGVLEGLHWRRTPQGLKHWYQVYAGEKKLSKRSRRYLNKLLSA